MKRIGLIGGMSWESTAVYYRLMNQEVRARLGNLHSADIILHSLDFEAVVALQKAGRWDQATRLLAASGQALSRAGADLLMIGSNTMHLIADEVAHQCPVPLLNIIDVTAHAIHASGCSRPLLLATRYTMEHGFYHQRMNDVSGLMPLVPNELDRALVHHIIFEELCQGIINEQSHAAMNLVIERGIAAGADSVILGCTEICLLLDPDNLPVPGFDSTRLHAHAAVDVALETMTPHKLAC